MLIELNNILAPMQDSIYHMTLNWHLFGYFAVKHDVSAMSKHDIVKDVTAYMSCVMRKPTFCICENKDADQLRGNREADQRLCFRYIDSTIPAI